MTPGSGVLSTGGACQSGIGVFCLGAERDGGGGPDVPGEPAAQPGGDAGAEAAGEAVVRPLLAGPLGAVQAR